MSTTKDKVLQRLKQQQPVSGQQLADELDVSRTAIWKQIQQLQQEGYKIETMHKKGYVLLEEPNSVTPQKIQSYLETETFGRQIYYEEQLSSTQPVAHQYAQQNVPSGTVVICEEQTAGKGRMNRVWTSQKGKGIWMSVIIRPDVPPYKAPQFTLVAAVAIAKAIEQVAHIRPAIKWPNDLLIGTKKVTGILTEMQADPDRVNALIMGIGMNVNHELQDFPDDLQQIATSLKMQTGKEIDRARLISEMLKNLEQYCERYVSEGFRTIKKEWEDYSCTLGARIKATTLRETFIGEAVALTDDGVLQIRLDNGEIKQVYSADIHFE